MELRLAPAQPEAIVVAGNARFSVLTPNLIRMEYSPTGKFRDAATQTVLNRDFPLPQFTTQPLDEGVEIRTADLRLQYRGGPFSAHSLSVTMRTKSQDYHFNTWHFGDPDFPPTDHIANLGGTARTLDGVDGPIALEPGIIAVDGFTAFNDSDSLELTADGWVAPKTSTSIESDYYFFGYGRRHQDALRAYFKLTGPTPLLRRETLGNWWSRFYRYSADSYLQLLDKFEEHEMPFSVAVIDMDWHLVDIDPALGSGWTGYTWNRALFPDPEAFLAELHRRHMIVTLNVHPADGVRRHELAYPEMAAAMGVDPASGEEIPFDIANRDFARSYFELLHHPLERQGVDFWWVDWQSGTGSSIPGLDPLWLLNDLHFKDSGRDGARPLTFSRYAGAGSHRNPIGFSGDTIISWESLDFQPYFTATAANIGYFWWSHDIGGHMLGKKDPELTTRWVQFGAFSPIMRLHSSNSPFGSKEPWLFGPEAERIMGDFLRLRHKLVPYLYTAMWRAHTDGVGPVRPLYHDYPGLVWSMRHPNVYLFGADMLVAPITAPRTEGDLARVEAWLPPGTWTDIFTGLEYRGDRTLTMLRGLETIPVLARSGSVIPLAADPMAPVGQIPDQLELLLFPGADGTADLVEDDGDDQPHTTRFNLTWDNGTLRLTSTPSEGVHRSRTIQLAIPGFSAAEPPTVNGTSVAGEWTHDGAYLRFDLGRVDLGATVEVAGLVPDAKLRERLVYRLIDDGHIALTSKEQAWNAYQKAVSEGDPTAAIATWMATPMPQNLRDALVEVITA